MINVGTSHADTVVDEKRCKNKMVSKTELHASEPKYNTKIKFGIKRNNSFITLPGKGDCSSLLPSKNRRLSRGRDCCVL